MQATLCHMMLCESTELFKLPKHGCLSSKLYIKGITPFLLFFHNSRKLIFILLLPLFLLSSYCMLSSFRRPIKEMILRAHHFLYRIFLPLSLSRFFFHVIREDRVRSLYVLMGTCRHWEELAYSPSVLRWVQ